MTQPKYVPIPLEDNVRPGYHLPTARAWTPDHRPAEHVPGRRAPRAGAGAPGPDQGYALRLARRFADRLVLSEHEHEHDVLVGAVMLAMRRAALFGRAPVATDLEAVLGLFGFLDTAPAELVELRRRLFGGVSHDYWDQRAVAASVSDDTLKLPAAELTVAKGRWRELATTTG